MFKKLFDDVDSFVKSQSKMNVYVTMAMFSGGIAGASLAKLALSIATDSPSEISIMIGIVSTILFIFVTILFGMYARIERAFQKSMLKRARDTEPRNNPVTFTKLLPGESRRYRYFSLNVSRTPGTSARNAIDIVSNDPVTCFVTREPIERPDDVKGEIARGTSFIEVERSRGVYPIDRTGTWYLTIVNKNVSEAYVVHDFPFSQNTVVDDE